MASPQPGRSGGESAAPCAGFRTIGETDHCEARRLLSPEDITISDVSIETDGSVAYVRGKVRHDKPNLRLSPFARFTLTDATGRVFYTEDALLGGSDALLPGITRRWEHLVIRLNQNEGIRRPFKVDVKLRQVVIETPEGPMRTLPAGG